MNGQRAGSKEIGNAEEQQDIQGRQKFKAGEINICGEVT